MPTQHVDLALDGTIASADFERIRAGYVPSGPQDKWFIYYDAPWLAFHRSQTGTCVFQLRVEPDDDHFRAPILRVNRDVSQYRNQNDEYDVELMAYLIDRFLLGRNNVPLPLPRGVHQRHRAAHERHVVGFDDGAQPGGFINLGNIKGPDEG